MRLEVAELYRLDLTFRRPVVTASGTHQRRPVLFVRIVTDVAEGWGECGALENGTAVDPRVSTVRRRLEEGGLARLVTATRARGGELPGGAQIAALYGSAPADRLCAAVIEMAVLDAELRASGEPLWSRLGARASRAGTGASAGELVGIPPSRQIGTLVESACAAAERGAARVRLKIEPGWDLEPLKAVRAALPDTALQADANGSYRLGSESADTARLLRRLDPLGLVCVEQPLPPSDLTSLALLAGHLETPVCLDESLASLPRLVDALRYHACEVACLKPARLGGLLAARRAVMLCADAGVPTFVGGFFETGFGRAALAALACIDGFTLPGDLSSPAGYLEDDPFAYPDVTAGKVRPWAVPGVAPHLADRLPGTLLARVAAV